MKRPNSPTPRFEPFTVIMRVPAVFKSIAAVVVLALAAPAAFAASGTWTNDASSVWSATTNWLGGIVADGTGNTADFTLNNTNVDTVTMDASHSLGTLLFGNNASATKNTWILNASGGSLLTLAGGTPTITVSNGVGAFINAAVATLPIGGTSGLTKTGSGTLVLGGTNTYSGTTAVNGGILQLTNTAAATSNSAVLYLSFDNVTGKTVINQGSGGPAMNGTLVGPATIAAGQGVNGGNALSIPAGSASAACVLVNNSVVPLNGNATGNWTVAMWLKTSTAGATYMYQGSGGWASGNTEFYLENGTQGDGAGTHQGGVRNSQAWVSGTAAINDGNWHHVAMTVTNGTKTLYLDGAVDAILSGSGSWTGTGTGSQIRIGGAAPGADSQIGLNGLIDEVYIYSRALSLAEIQALTNGPAGPTVNVPVPAASDVAVAAAAKLDLNGTSTGVAGLSGSGTVDTTVTGAILAINNTANYNFTGLVTNSTGTLTLLKLGSGNQTLSGTITNTGATIVNNGTLTLSGLNNIYNSTMTVNGGTLVLSGTNNSTGTHTLNFNGVLQVTGNGAINSVNGTSTRLVVGAHSGANAAVYQSGAGTSVNIFSGGGGNFQLGSVAGAFGYYNLSSGSLVVGNGSELDPGGSGGGAGTFGQYDQSGGTLTIGNSGTGATYFLPNRGGVGESSVVNITGGTVTINPTMNDAQFGGFEMNWAAGTQTNATTISGNAVFSSLNCGVKLNFANNAGNVASLNLDGGTFQVSGFSANQNASAVINFNGGTLKAGNAIANNGNNVANDNNFLANVASVYVYSGGATFDDNGNTVTIAQQFQAPAGSGVSSIPVATGGAGYSMPPQVIITDSGSGSGATAYAQIDSSTGNGTSGQVTNIVVSNPGNNYSSPAVTLVGGTAGTAATIGTVVTTANTSGGLTKLGAGTLTLSGGYTYTGPTKVLGGTLSVNQSAVTSGDLIVSNAAFTVDASGGTAMPVGNLTLQSNAVVNLTLNPSANGINASGNLSLSASNMTINLNYGTLAANPTAPAINVGGSVSSGIFSLTTINISALGMKPGTFTLIKYTGSPLANLANFTVTLPPGVVATLVNNAGNDSIDLNVTSSPNFLTWYGSISTNWDINTTMNWKNGVSSSVYQQYTNGSVVVGDAVQFDDTLFAGSPPPTNVNLTTQVSSFPVIFNSTMPYSFSGVGGITGGGFVVASNTGSLTINTSNSYTGGTFVNGATVVITNDSALGGSSGKISLGGGILQVNASTTNATRPVSVTANSQIGVVTNATYQLGGTVSGTGGLTKIDNGTLILAGSNLITGPFVVSQGKAQISGNNVLPAILTVGNTANINAVLNVAGGSLVDTANGGFVYTSSLIIGSVAASAGDMQVTSGTHFLARQLAVGGGLGDYGGYSQSGGAMTLGGFLALGLGSDSSVFNLTGGTFAFTNLGVAPPITIGAGATGTGVMTVSGSAAFNNTNAANFDASGGNLWIGEAGTGVLNLQGGTVSLTNSGVIIGKGNGGAQSPNGTVNLNGGTLTTTRVFKLATGGTSTLNFNGGTLKAAAANGAFISGLTSANDFSGGATIDDGGFTVSSSQALLAPTGYGVASITLSSGGSGYIDSPVVTISGGTGSNATAIATVAGGTVTGITVTCPGTGYTSGDSLSVSFTGGGGANVLVAATANTPVLTANPNASGGLTKKGAGTLNLTGADTYTNTTAVSAGTLLVSPLHQVTGPVTVASNTAFGVLVNTTGAATVGNLTLGTVLADKTTLSFAMATGTNPVSAVLQTGTLTLNATNTMVRLSGTVPAGTFPILHYTGAIAGSGSFNTNVTAPQGQLATLSNSVALSTLYVTVTGTPGIIWTGTNSVATLTNVWNLNSATNWLAAGVPTFYQETAPPGDPVLFNDIGSGVVLLSNTASPASVTISNNAVGYSFRGTGHVSGTAGLTKQGSGTANYGLTNSDYSGNTTVSGGVLQLGTANAIPAASSLTVNTPGTLDINSFADTVGGLSGSGTINNSGATTVALTVGSGNVSSTWSGTITNTGAGGITLLKVGTGALAVNGSNYVSGTQTAQINGGSMTLNPNSQINCLGTGEFWIGGSATGAVTNNGGTLTVNSWLVVGRTTTNANGTLVVNSGTIQKTGANNIVVGSLTATGTLIVNGGQVLNNGNLWLGENAGANGTLYLNGGLIQATTVRFNGTTPSTYIAYFNGGTLQATASATNFLQVVSMVMSNGLVLDDNGFVLSIGGAALQNGDGFGGGLVKKGAGTVYLDVANTYTGATVVTNGTLAGVGSISGPVIVGPAGTIGAGDPGTAIGTFSISGDMTINGSANMRINKDVSAGDKIFGIATAHYGGTLVVSNISTSALTTSDTFQLFSASAATGNFTSIVGSPGTGLAYQFTPSSGVLSIVTNGVATNPTNLTFSVNGNALTIGWPGDHLTWILQAQTNGINAGINTNHASWHDISGSGAVTQEVFTITSTNPTVFYRLRSP